MTTKFKVGETYETFGCNPVKVIGIGSKYLICEDEKGYISARQLDGRNVNNSTIGALILPKRRLKCWVQWYKSTRTGEECSLTRTEAAPLDIECYIRIGTPIEVLGPEVDDE